MVRPGITGLWQVSGRNRTHYVDRIHYDEMYFNSWSVSLDLYLLWRTIKTALLREGAC
ncbi:MAG: sugar transferase [Pseudomonadota bacterium]